MGTERDRNSDMLREMDIVRLREKERHSERVRLGEKRLQM